ncbi:MAG: rhomboid family intramembrane serine protease [Actinomycetota bacterium]
MAVCYRHPDRETGVSCSNCGRPICADCMTSTPVGMRCPECARQRTKVRTGTSAFGRAAGAPATFVLIGISVVAFLAELAGGVGGLEGGGPVITDFGVFGPAIADGEWYRIVTGTFLHAGPIHLLFNMFALYILGTFLEPSLGAARFTALYVASMLAGSLGVVVLEPVTNSVGASGAVFGLFAAAFVIARGRGMEQIATQLGALILLNLLITFTVPRISIGAHLFGAGAGVLCALLILAGDRGRLGPNRMVAEIGAMVALGVISAVATVAVA